MIMAGTNIISTEDKLVKMQIENLYHSLRNPRPAIDARIRQLRILYEVDPKQYARQKRTLPYFVCGIFNPPYRRTENFAYTEYFILDIDKVSANILSLQDIRQKIISDERVLLSFKSPSHDGLKVMFRFSEKCHDAGLFTIFYKSFALSFARQYGLEQVIDSKTCDVARACFISIDEDAYYNPDAVPVNLQSVVDTDNPVAVAELRHQTITLPVAPPQEEAAPAEKSDPDPDREVMDRIKQLLNPALRKKKEAAPVVVPQVLNDIIDDLTAYINQTGLVVTEVINIQYAKKIRIRMGIKQAEINLFYGRRGFSVVISPRTGTDEELNQLTAELIQSYIDTL